MRDHARSLERQLLQYCLNTTPFGLIAQRRIGLIQGVLSKQSPQVHRHSSELAHQIVGIELARGNALAQSWTGRHGSKPKRTLEEGIASKALDSIVVAFTHAQQDELAFGDFAIGNPEAHWKSGVAQRVDVNALEVFADKNQPYMGSLVIRQFFDNKVSHVLLTYWVSNA